MLILTLTFNRCKTSNAYSLARCKTYYSWFNDLRALHTRSPNLSLVSSVGFTSKLHMNLLGLEPEQASSTVSRKDAGRVLRQFSLSSITFMQYVPPATTKILQLRFLVLFVAVEMAFKFRKLLDIDQRKFTIRNKCLHRSEEHTSELQSRPHTSYAVFCLKKKTQKTH